MSVNGKKSIIAMVTILILAAFVVLLVAVHGSEYYDDIPRYDVEDISPDAHVFSARRFPSLHSLAPSIGNGHLATTIFSDTVYMNGLYNGESSSSHRARIPSWANVRLRSTMDGYESNRNVTPIYSLNTKSGVFSVNVNRERSFVIHRVYAHRYYTRAIINQIKIEAKKLYGDPNHLHQNDVVELVFDEGSPSNDLVFDKQEMIELEGRYVFHTCGKTLILESMRYQPHPSEVCVYWTRVPAELVVPKQGHRTHTFVMVADKNNSVALKEMKDILREDEDDLYTKHVTEWKARHDMGFISIEGDLQLAKVINGAWYYLLSSLPSHSTNQPLDLFYGLSPGSLSRGSYESYSGHNFWDTETWMLPPILVLYPDLARVLLNYRLAMIDTAVDYSNETGYDGARFPWESAFTGIETTDDTNVATYEQHITGCISFAIRQYISTTKDENFLQNRGCDLVKKIAQFWASRVTYNNYTGLYDINSVMGPDENYANINNSVFTNVIAGYALYLGQYITCLCSSNELDESEKWEEIAMKLTLMYDRENDFHPEYSGYIRRYPVKQADVILLGFPLQYVMNQSTRVNDLNYYQSVNRGSGPAMSWSMYSIGYLQTNYNDEANELFKKSYETYVNEPFKIWSENNKDSPDIGAVNFITGMGGFLQSVIFGYGGIRIHLDRLEIVKPQLPPDTTKLSINGISYLGSRLNLNIRKGSSSTLEVISCDSRWPLEVHLHGHNITLLNGITVNLYGEGPFIIRTTNEEDCAIPSHLIGQTGREYSSN